MEKPLESAPEEEKPDAAGDVEDAKPVNGTNGTAEVPVNGSASKPINGSEQKVWPLFNYY